MNLRIDTNTGLQNLEKAYKTMGYATQVKSLSDFYDHYGLEGDDEDGKTDAEGGEEEDEDDDDDESGEESGTDDETED